MSGAIKPKDFINTIASEGIKRFVVFDGSSREEAIFEAPLGLAAGNDCIVTYLGYDGSSTRVESMIETVGEWTSAMEVAVQALLP